MKARPMGHYMGERVRPDEDKNRSVVRTKFGPMGLVTHGTMTSPWDSLH